MRQCRLFMPVLSRLNPGANRNRHYTPAIGKRLSNAGNASRIVTLADGIQRWRRRRKLTRFRTHSEMIQITLNGQPQHFDTPLNVAQLLESMALQGKRIAVERNGEIVPRSQFGEQVLADGDRLEIVVAVGGG